jgi:RES domain-containing protein
MQVWRLSRKIHANLSGEGARLAGGRWNSPGRPVIYCAQDASLAMLEVRVHLDLPFELLPEDYIYSAIETGDLSIEEADFPATEQESRDVGDDWLRNCRTALLRVPSIIVPHGRNILINPLHPDAKLISITNEYPCLFDQRLWRG